MFNRKSISRKITHPQSWRMRNFTWHRFPIKHLLIDSLLTPIVESTYLTRDMCKFESSQKDENRWQSTDSSKAYSNTSAFKCHCQWFHTFGFYCLLITVGVCACERLLCSTRYQSRKNNRKKTKLLLLEILPLKATASKAYIGNPACIRQEFGDVTDPTKP